MQTSNNLKSIPLIVTSFVCGSAVTYYFISCNKSKRLAKKGEERTEKKKCSTKGNNTQKTSKQIMIPPEMRAEQLSRNELYFGGEGMESIINSKILIVGLGGVGSHTAHMLARAGVSYLRLVDFDQVTLSSLNRNACATLEDVGIPKVVCLQRFLAKVCGNCCEVDTWVQMYTGDDSKDGEMMTCPKEKGGKWDIIIDAIDDVPTKARLLGHCIRNNIRVISCMGAGGKSDMTRLHISDIRSASRDPLASKLRQTLKKQLKNDNSVKDESYLSNVDKVAVLYSSEKVVCKLADFTDEQLKEGVQNFGAVDNMRIRVIPVLGTMPAIMGQSLAALALCELGGKPFTPLSGERLGRNARNRIFQHFKNRENSCREIIEVGPTNEGANEKDGDCDTNMDYDSIRIIDGKWVGPLQIDSDDVDYLFSEVWRNRCSVTGEALGTVLELSRWDLSKPSNCQNIVLLGVKAMIRYDEELTKSGDGRNCFSLEQRARIEHRLRTCKIDSRA